MMWATTLAASKLLEGTLRHFRSRRLRRFEQQFALTPETTVLDVGGSLAIWRFVSVKPRLTIINLPTALEQAENRVQQLEGDGCRLPFRDRSFDIVFSNSVIEHVGSRQNQQLFAAEAARVGRRYWVQTPDRRSPIEMHVMLPFVHLLPKAWGRAVIQRFTLWERLTHPSEAQKAYFLNHILNELLLLDADDLHQLFPEARIVAERVLGIPKSLIAYRA